MIQMKQEKFLPLTTDPCFIDFLKCYVCYAHTTMTKSPLLEGQFAILFYKAAPTETAIPNSHVLNVSLHVQSKKEKKQKQFYSSHRELKMLQPKTLDSVQPSG